MFEISVIIPTYNESENIIGLIDEVQSQLEGYDYEIIVVDDNSPDGTHLKVKDYAKNNSEVYCINRTWKKGLSSAVVEGVALSTKRYISVMDGDGQHDPKDLKRMIELAKAEDSDIVIGSRFLNEANTASLSANRNKLSKVGISITNLFSNVRSTDPLSGLFLIRKEKFTDCLLYTSPSPRDLSTSRMPSSA